MKLKKTLTALGVAAMLVGATGVANAAIQINNWTIDLGAIGALGGGDNWGVTGVNNPAGYGVFGTNGVLGINQMAFNALYHTIIAGPIGVGTLQHTDTLGVVTQAVNGNGLVGVTTTGALLNNTILPNPPFNTFELTFASTTTQVISGIAGPVVVTSHLAPQPLGPNGVATNGYLNVYADICSGGNNGDGSVCANSSILSGGTGMDDGLLIASFKVRPQAFSGSFNVVALDGQDDATFELVFNYGGIIKDQFGVALALGSTLGFTNSNTDDDDDNNGAIDSLPAGWGAQGLGACGATTPITGAPSAVDSCGVEDGSLNLAVPEPASLALVGVAMIGLGLARRRARK